MVGAPISLYLLVDNVLFAGESALGVGDLFCKEEKCIGNKGFLTLIQP